MERRGPRPRPGLCCQLIWPQAQAHSTTANAVILQLRLASVLFAVSFYRLLKTTVGCNPLLYSGIHTSANHSFMQLVSCPLARGSQKPPPMPIAGVSGVSGTAVSLPLPGWCDRLAGHSFLPCSSPRFSLHKH